MTQNPAASPADSVAALEQRFRALERANDPVAWAVSAYRVGLAKAEEPSANPRGNLETALGYYEHAAEVLTAERAPVEHARVLNAAASARRMLGDSAAAVRLFTKAAQLLDGRGALAEEASVLNNLGLVLTEAGRVEDAVAAFSQSMEKLPAGSAEDLRTMLATKHNLAQAHMARGGLVGCEAAIAELDEAAELAKDADAAMHRAMIWHSLGVAWKAKAALGPDDPVHSDSQQHSDSQHHSVSQAIGHFQNSLTIFTSVGFPFQHAVAKHNLGHALAARTDLASLQRALVSYEDALNIFDLRLHRPHWEEAFNNAQAVEERLQQMVPGSTRADHTASLVGSMDEVERLGFLRARLAQIARLPEKNRLERLTEFSYAVVTQPAASYVATLRTIISVLMELPESMLQTTLKGLLEAHSMLEAGDRRASDFILDEAINLLLFGPQRIRVRDLLQEMGWERP